MRSWARMMRAKNVAKMMRTMKWPQPDTAPRTTPGPWPPGHLAGSHGPDECVEAVVGVQVAVDLLDHPHGAVPGNLRQDQRADLRALRDLLIAEGTAMLQRPFEFVRFTGDDNADALLNDLAHYPHPFLFARLVDRQIPAERTWKVLFIVRERLGSLELTDFVAVDEARWMDVMRNPTPAHRLPETMATVLFRATQRVASHYDSDASHIWNDTPSSAAVSLIPGH
jgi:hypothetical protein